MRQGRVNFKREHKNIVLGIFYYIVRIGVPAPFIFNLYLPKLPHP